MAIGKSGLFYPTAAMDSSKIQLDQKSDIVFLKNQLKTYAASLLNSKLSLCADIAKTRNTSQQTQIHSQSSVEKEVRSKIQKWVDELFSLCGNGIQINGQDYHKVMENADHQGFLTLTKEYEPINEVIQKNVNDMHHNLASKMVQVTQQRRTVPGQVRDLVEKSLCILTDLTQNAEVIRIEFLLKI